MYFGKRTNKKAVIITVIATLVIIAGLIAINMMLSRRTQRAIDMSRQSETGDMAETEENYYRMTVYKSIKGDVTYNPAALLSTDDERCVYLVPAMDEVTLAISPAEGFLLESASAKEEDGMPVSLSLAEQDARFVMPQQDVYVTVNYREDPDWEDPSTEPETESETEILSEAETVPESTPLSEVKPEPETEPLSGTGRKLVSEPLSKSETESETEPPAESITEPPTEAAAYDTYNLTLYGASADQIQDFGNPFREDYFLYCLGQAFSMGDPGSYYFAISKVTFADQRPEQEVGNTSRYVYLQDDPTWLILASYYPLSNTYIFTDTTGRANVKPETEPSVQQQNGGGYVPDNSGNYGTGYTYPVPQTVTTTTTLTLQNVSTVFLSFITDGQALVDQLTSYIFNQGITGSLTGDFTGYEIDPEAQTAVFTISLSGGGIINGTYDKNSNTYSFYGG